MGIVIYKMDKMNKMNKTDFYCIKRLKITNNNINADFRLYRKCAEKSFKIFLLLIEKIV